MMRAKSVGEEPSPGFPQLLDAQSAADLLGVSAATLDRWAALRDQGADVGPPCYACLSACADGTPTSCANGSAGYAGRWRAAFRAVSESGSRLTGPPGASPLSRTWRDNWGSWVETSSTFSSLREARAFKAERDAEA